MPTSSPIYLPPAERAPPSNAAAVDAWVIWDPFLAAAEKQLGARVLADGKGLVANHQFYLAARPSPKSIRPGAHRARRNRQGRRVGREESHRKWRASSPPRPACRSTRWRWRLRAIVWRQADYAGGAGRAAEDRRRLPQSETDTQNRSSARCAAAGELLKELLVKE
jgi:hypothetical protein